MVRGAAISHRLRWLVFLSLIVACAAPPRGVAVLDVVLFGTDVYDGADGIAADGEGRVAVVGYVEDGLGSVPSLGGVEPYDAFLVLLEPPAF